MALIMSDRVASIGGMKQVLSVNSEAGSN